MKIEKLNQWLALGANFGVLIGIIFLSMEINQSNRIAIGTAEYETSRDFNEISRIILTDASIRELIVRLEDTDEELVSASEIRQGLALAFTYYTTWSGIQAAYTQGLVSQEYYEDLLVDVEAIIGLRPKLKYAWETVLARGYVQTELLQTMEKAVSDI